MVVAGLALLLAPMACTTTIRPPAAVEQPERVVLLDHGRHSSLVLPDGRGGFIRYAYGDWTWYARSRTGVLEAIQALLLPSKAGLGRARFAGPLDAGTVDRRTGVVIEQSWTIRVEAARVRGLRSDLEATFEAGRKRAVENPRFGLTFAPHPSAYSYFQNSNHRAAAWLRELGCEVSGPAFAARWRVRGSEAAAAAEPSDRAWKAD